MTRSFLPVALPPRRADRLVCRLPFDDCWPVSNLFELRTCLPIGRDGAVEGRVGECFVCHGRDDVATAVGCLGVAGTLATPEVHAWPLEARS